MVNSSAFNVLSMRQQRALFERAAAVVLPHWRIGDYNIGWISYSNNAVFEVKTAKQQFVLRMHPPGRTNVARLRSEMRWLRALSKRANLSAPRPVPTADGSLFVSFPTPLSRPADQIHCVVFERLEGEAKPAPALSSADAGRVGKYLGRLHRDGQINLPSDFDRRQLDIDGMFGVDSPYYVLNEQEVICQEQRQVFAAVEARVRQEMTCQVRREDRVGLIHADLLAKNILFIDDTVAALDFEYFGRGYFLYDLAPLLWQLKGERKADYDELAAALWNGYLTVRPEAADQHANLETLVAARQLLSCRWLLQNWHNPTVRELAPALIQERADELQHFLSTGVLMRRSATL